MSLLTYQDLKDAILEWPDRTGNVDLTAQLDTIVTLAEARINRELRLQGMITSLNDSDVNGIETRVLPLDFLEMDRVTGPEGESLEPRPVDELYRLGHPPREPCFYGIEGRNIIFAPSVTEFTLFYYALMPPLQVDDTHWLYAKAPDLYLYAGLVESSIFDKESEQELGRYTAKFQSIVQSLMLEESVAKYPRSQPIRSLAGRVGRKNRSG